MSTVVGTSPKKSTKVFSRKTKVSQKTLSLRAMITNNVVKNGAVLRKGLKKIKKKPGRKENMKWKTERKRESFVS